MRPRSIPNARLWLYYGDAKTTLWACELSGNGFPGVGVADRMDEAKSVVPSVPFGAGSGEAVRSSMGLGPPESTRGRGRCWALWYG